MGSTKLNLDNFSIVDTFDEVSVPDSFVVPSNKIGVGNGEAKLYLGTESSVIRNFFGTRKIIIRCLVFKSDLKEYMQMAKMEYFRPTQSYKRSDELQQLYGERLSKIEQLDDYVEFELSEQSQLQGSRVYLKSANQVFTLIRELTLPNFSRLKFVKLMVEKNFIFYLKLQFGHSKDDKYFATEDHVNSKVRKGQLVFREKLIEECCFCPITKISDRRLLIASHIKPWSVSSDKERLDVKNGLLLSPLYDKLFDLGLISFDSNKLMIISRLLSKKHCSELGLEYGKVINDLPVLGRENYLEYHRENVFLKLPFNG